MQRQSAKSSGVLNRMPSGVTSRSILNWISDTFQYPRADPGLSLTRTALDVVALHPHKIRTTPDVFFLHYWGKIPVQKLAPGVRAAVDQLARPTH